ncbi:MAG TPA: rhamnulokinase [Terracidiphilus sp.]|nr:rhamnulokinase [Terracidiphilus sp.]
MSRSDYAKSPRCLAIDLGAGSGRLVLGQVLNGRWSLSEVGRFRTATKHSEKPDYQCWDLDGILGEIERHITLACAFGRPASLGVDGWGVDYVLLDENLREVGLPVCYRDGRTNGMVERVQQRVSRVEIYRRTGIQFLSFNTLYQLAACVEQEPKWIEDARHFLMIPDYLHFRLSGALSNEYTNATTTQMCGLDGEWDPVLMDAIGLRRPIMRNPIPAGTCLGDGIGAASGLKVIAPATHDTASAVAGTPLEDDEAYISSGTWSLMGIESAVPIATPEALAMNFTNEGGLERRFRVLKNIMGMWPIQRICEEQKISDFAGLVQQAEEMEPWRSIINVNDPEFLNPASMTESIRTYCRDSGQPVPESLAQLGRCVFDSLALSYSKVKAQLEQLRGRKLSSIRVVGGGCQNELLNRLSANACGLPIIAGPVEASALGNLSSQMIALGVLENLNVARKLIRSSFDMKVYQPVDGVPDVVFRRFEELLATTELRGAACA